MSVEDASLEASPMPALSKDELQRCFGDSYEIRRELGGGGMSRVYEAFDPRLRRRIVIKVLDPQRMGELNVDRFLREIQLSAALQHPHIVTVLAAGVCASLPYYTMPFIEGESLRERLRRGPLDISECVDVLRDISKALSYAHGQGVLHRDIKPDNVMLSDGSAIVTDFGIAIALDASIKNSSGTLTRSDNAIGTPAYMSPEQVACDPAIDHRADLYALGATAFELLTGLPPFGDRPPASLLAAHLVEPPPPLSHSRADIPVALDALVSRCLAKDPDARPRDAKEVLTTLDALARGGIVHGTKARSDYRSSIAVLPFTNMSASRDNEFLSDGIAEELMTAFGRMPGLRVAARASCFAYRGQSPDPRAAGASLRVETLLTGSVSRSGNALRIRVELVRCADSVPLWSERFDRQVADIFLIQDEITEAILSALRPTLISTAPAPAQLRQTTNVDAYTLYLRGRYFFNRRQEQLLWQSIECYERAITLDREYALAYSGIADSCGILALFMALSPDKARERMRAAAERALALGAGLAEAHASMGMYELLLGWDLDSAEHHFKKALQLDPQLSMASAWLGQLLVQQGRMDEGLRAASRAMSLEPLSAAVHTNAAFVYHLASRHEDVIRILDGVLELDPGRPTALWILAWTHLAMSRTTEAVAVLERVVTVVNRNPWWLASLAFAYAEDGRIEDARATLLELSTSDKSHHVPQALLARAHLALGDLNEGFRLARLALETGELNAWGILTHPGWRQLREHPEFDSLTAAMKTHFRSEPTSCS
ncbi:MAG: protein kinase [Gemmatimonadota bacterium]